MAGEAGCTRGQKLGWRAQSCGGQGIFDPTMRFGECFPGPGLWRDTRAAAATRWVHSSESFGGSRGTRVGGVGEQAGPGGGRMHAPMVHPRGQEGTVRRCIQWDRRRWEGSSRSACKHGLCCRLRRQRKIGGRRPAGLSGRRRAAAAAAPHTQENQINDGNGRKWGSNFELY